MQDVLSDDPTQTSYEVHLVVPVGQMLESQLKKGEFGIFYLTQAETKNGSKCYIAKSVFKPLPGESWSEASAKTAFLDECKAAEGVMGSAVRTLSHSGLVFV